MARWNPFRRWWGSARSQPQAPGFAIPARVGAWAPPVTPCFSPVVPSGVPAPAPAPDEVARLQAILRMSPYPDVKERARKRLAELTGGAAGAGAVAAPQAAYGPEATVLVLDHSGSMGAGDYPPSRLGAAQSACEEFLRIKAAQTPNDIVSVVVFDNQAQVAIPWTPVGTGCHELRVTVWGIDVQGGTDINEGLLAAEWLIDAVPPGTATRIILLTDGQGGNPVATAVILKARGVVIDVIGIGGARTDVNEDCLMKVASVVGQPPDLRYRFITDWQSLVQHFRSLANRLAR